MNSWKLSFSLQLISSPGPKSFQLFLWKAKKVMKVIPAAGPGSPYWVYLVATSCAYSPRLSWASHHTHSAFKLAVGDKKAAISALATSTNPRRNGRTWEQCWYFTGGGMEGYQVSAWYSSHLVSPDHIVIRATKGLKNAVFLHGMWPLFPTSYRDLPFVCVKVCLHDKWPFYCLYTLTCTHVGERGMLVRWLLTSDQQPPSQFKHTISILPVNSLPTNSCKRYLGQKTLA